MGSGSHPHFPYIGKERDNSFYRILGFGTNLGRKKEKTSSGGA